MRVKAVFHPRYFIVKGELVLTDEDKEQIISIDWKDITIDMEALKEKERKKILEGIVSKVDL